jgi:hypothetical protein
VSNHGFLGAVGPRAQIGEIFPKRTTLEHATTACSIQTTVPLITGGDHGPVSDPSERAPAEYELHHTVSAARELAPRLPRSVRNFRQRGTARNHVLHLLTCRSELSGG